MPLMNDISNIWERVAEMGSASRISIYLPVHLSLLLLQLHWGWWLALGGQVTYTASEKRYLKASVSSIYHSLPCCEDLVDHLQLLGRRCQSHVTRAWRVNLYNFKPLRFQSLCDSGDKHPDSSRMPPPKPTAANTGMPVFQSTPSRNKISVLQPEVTAEVTEMLVTRLKNSLWSQGHDSQIWQRVGAPWAWSDELCSRELSRFHKS